MFSGHVFLRYRLEGANVGIVAWNACDAKQGSGVRPCLLPEQLATQRRAMDSGLVNPRERLAGK